MLTRKIKVEREAKIKKILGFDNYEIYYLIDELQSSSALLWVLIESDKTSEEFWKELERNDMISSLIRAKPASERRDYYKSRKKFLKRALENENYESAAEIKHLRGYFRHCFANDIPEEELY
jgi:hypothetical protein